jgi:MoaA/NifB/PqqE/SkfB family radical SAM enzyme
LNRLDVIVAWGRILSGYKPLLSIEITRECPLRCPGCYAYDNQHLGGTRTLRDLSDYRNQELTDRVLALVSELRPLHVSIVGGDPLVRWRELETLLPALSHRGVWIQLVTSAFRPIPAAWAALPRFEVVISVDGLAPEHDRRRQPATYERILKNIAAYQGVTIHCTVTRQMTGRPTYLEEFLQFWTPHDVVRRIWISLFTPQKGANNDETLSRDQRRIVVSELLRLRKLYPKLDINEDTLREFEHPPASPESCIFAQTTETVSADLTTRIDPCQFGGNPDCTRCGCLASMALAGIGTKTLLPGLQIRRIFQASTAIGKRIAWVRELWNTQ